MSKLREAAAMLVEQGRALGALEQQRATAAALMRQAAVLRTSLPGMPEMAESLERVASGYAEQIPGLERLAKCAQDQAQQLMSELEHPGAVLGRRLLASARAARAAWRAR